MIKHANANTKKIDKIPCILHILYSNVKGKLNRINCFATLIFISMHKTKKNQSKNKKKTGNGFFSNFWRNTGFFSGFNFSKFFRFFSGFNFSRFFRFKKEFSGLFQDFSGFFQNFSGFSLSKRNSNQKTQKMPGLTKFFEKTHADPQKFWKEKKHRRFLQI